MQFNSVNDQEQVAQLVRPGLAWRSVALRGVALALGGCGGCLKRFVARVFYWAVGCFPRAFSGSSSGQRLLCVLDVRLRMASWLWLGSAFGTVAFVCFLVFPLPPLPIRGGRGFSSIVSPLNVLFSVTGARFGVWGLGSGVAGGARGWVAGRAGLWGCPTDLGLGCWGQSPDP